MPENDQSIRGGCPHDCPDTCAWRVTVRDGEATALRGDPDHPFTRGGLCAKVDRYLDRVYGEERLLHALRRTGPKGSGSFQRIGIDAALDEVARRLRSVIEVHGGTGVLPYSYNGTQGLLHSRSLDRRFFRRIGATRLERSICADTAIEGLWATLGTSTAVLPEQMIDSRFIVLWGTNPIVTNLHLWPLIQQARHAGARLVVVDPLRTRTARACDWHVRPLPGTDAALALGMMHVIVEEGLVDGDYVERHTVGFEALVQRLADYTPERVARLTGVDAGEVRALARTYAANQPALIRVLVGMEHHTRGAMAVRTIACLPALVGAWRHRGGGLMHLTASPFFEALRPLDRPEWEDPSIRSTNMVELGKTLTELDPPIAALLVYGSNPAVTAPNQEQVLRGLAREDLFVVVHDQLLTDTARYSDIVLPATTQLEHWDLMWSWGHTFLTLNTPAIAPRGDALSNTELFRRLARRLGLDDPELYAGDMELVHEALGSGHTYLDGITAERLMRDGWAPLSVPGDPPFAEGGFPTPSGKCELYSERWRQRGLDPLPGYTPAPESPAGDPARAARYPLLLLTTKSAVRFLNSSYAGLAHHRAREGEPRLDLHPADAAKRGIVDGDRVRVFNDRGALELRARVGEWTRPGVVSMPFGWWTASHAGGRSANVLTRDGVADGGGGDFHDTLVQVEAARTPRASADS